ncbi:hypothetical protein [Bacillus sp. TH13]|uniref:hypothetical protein n=1 Tax=Bacillus sp. TH13 TaxID=2796379 RepID=UPI001912BA22|nr:hypothetical protein [Bacillus sp. TH13]MBK5493194.1 hypothetical protein [Bacillus sp. TH13]
MMQKERQMGVLDLKPESNTARLKNINENTLQESYNRLPQEGMYLDEIEEHKQIKRLLNTEEQKSDYDNQELEEIEEYEQNDMELFLEVLKEREDGSGRM